MEENKKELTNDIAVLEQICDYINQEFFQTPVNSSNGYYLNHTYKEIAENIGCTLKKDNKYGLKLDKIPQKLIEYCEKFDWSVYNFYVSESSLNKRQTLSNSRKYMCPNCGGIARTTSDFPLICKRCGVDLIYMAK